MSCYGFLCYATPHGYICIYIHICIDISYETYDVPYRLYHMPYIIFHIACIVCLMPQAPYTCIYIYILYHISYMSYVARLHI